MRAKASFLILTTIAIGPVVAASEWAPSGPFDEQVTIEFGFNNSHIKSRFSVDGNIADQNLGAQVNLENLFGLDDSSSDAMTLSAMLALSPQRALITVNLMLPPALA